MLKEIHYQEGLPVAMEVMRVKNFPWHTHNDIQILYVIEGEIELKMVYTRYRLIKNNIHIVHNEDVHGIRSISKNNLIAVLSLNMDYFIKYYPTLDTQVFTSKISENIATYKKQLALKAYIFSIISELHDEKKGYKERVTRIAHDLVDALYEDFRGFTVNTEKRIFEHQISRDLMQTDRISRIVNLVYCNYPYKLSLTDIAKQEGINNYYLSHLFQRLVGDSFRNFVSMVRVEMSETRLLTTDNSIAQISADVGFSNPKYYVENFRQWFGCHPKEYRQLYKKEVISDTNTADIILMPLSSINDAIESFGELPVFLGAAPQVHSAVFDMKKALKQPFGSSETAPASKLYKECNPQQDAVNFLNKYFTEPDKTPLPQTFTDSPENPNGAFTCNGMPKPLYYLRRFISAQAECISIKEPSYMITTDGSNIQILFFNSSSDKPQDFEFNFLHMPGNHLITQHRLSSDSSCIRLWQDLRFKEPLTQQEINQICAMSTPHISWSSVDSSGSFSYSATLAPLDIMFTEISEG